MMKPSVKISKVSSLYITPPWEMRSENLFYNQVLQVESNLSPRELLESILKLEALIGRQRSGNETYEDRLIDIDILLFGEQIVREADLMIPQKNLEKRAFALLPLLELEPDILDPLTKTPFTHYLEGLTEEVKAIQKLDQGEIHSDRR